MPDPWSFKAEYAAGHGATSEAASPGRQTAYGQIGWRLLPKLQAILRYDWWDPNTGAGQDIQNEVILGLNYFIDGHRFKVQGDFAFHNEEGPSTPNDILRIALQMSL